MDSLVAKSASKKVSDKRLLFSAGTLIGKLSREERKKFDKLNFKNNYLDFVLRTQKMAKVIESKKVNCVLVDAIHAYQLESIIKGVNVRYVGWDRKKIESMFRKKIKRVEKFRVKKLAKRKAKRKPVRRKK